ncbi:BTB/POZ domain-containing protein SETH6 [Hibiscus syriacus]|uniref:BTB/POZ domain-containing protein SETH6 n=1 Tax=Hibiscus syriacus TaxID=106335 RepID=A0A6A3A6U7_HIBSY|nr:BTB/POZ domain-containing protein SETH6 [Hibiscus syriacus]
MVVVTIAELKPSMSGKRSFRQNSSSIRHATEWPISDVSSDIIVEVGASSFALHKVEQRQFELAAKFCYGINVEIRWSNVAMLKCASHFLEMTEEISSSISVLHCCKSLLPVSEEISLVNRLINAIANNACREQLTSGLMKLDHNFRSKAMPSMALETPSDWWGKSGGSQSRFLPTSVISSEVKGDPHLVKGSLLDFELQKKQRAIVEVIVSLLPTQSRKSLVPTAFLSSLLKTAIASSVSTSCKSDLERRIGLQLDQAILEDILIPANSHGNNYTAVYDTESILRIFSIFLNLDDEEEEEDNLLKDECDMAYDFDTPRSPKQSSILKVSKLFDTYLAEVALHTNLLPSKFIALAESLPDHARVVSDGLYNAVDIFLKVHPNIKDSERYRLCKTIDCQKLSQEACSHAAQNERLPVQMAVQMLYFEQIRLRNAMSGGGHTQFFFGATNGKFPQRSSSGVGSGAISPRDNYASVRRENRELKLEVTRMRMRLTDLEKDHVSMKQEFVRPHPANKLLKSLTNKLRKLHSLFRINNLKPAGSKANSESRFSSRRRRRYSES